MGLVVIGLHCVYFANGIGGGGLACELDVSGVGCSRRMGEERNLCELFPVSTLQ